MEYTLLARVVNNSVDDAGLVYSSIRIKSHQIISSEFRIPVKLPLGTDVFVTITDEQPEGGAA